MRPPKIKITVTNKPEFKAKISSAQRRLSNRKSVHEKLYTEWFSERWILNFHESGRLYQRWSPLSATWTQKERSRLGYGADRPKLVRDGSLLDDFVQQVDEAIFGPEITEWDFRNNPPHYALSHHMGFENPIPNRNPIPARILFDINRLDQREVRDRFLKYIISVLGDY